MQSNPSVPSKTYLALDICVSSAERKYIIHVGHTANAQIFSVTTPEGIQHLEAELTSLKIATSLERYLWAMAYLNVHISTTAARAVTAIGRRL